METIIMVGQLLLALTIMVGLHEFGHLYAAKKFGMRVEKYYIGFPPKLYSRTWGETEYAIGAIPLGGFVKISGMIDESLDTKNLKSEPEPWEFRAKPAWQRLIVMLGGIIMNVLTGIIVFVTMALVYGEEYIPKSEVDKHGIYVEDVGRKIGLQTGDKIINISGQDYGRFSDLISPDVLLSSSAYYTVVRNGKTVKVEVPSDILEDLSDRRSRQSLMAIRQPVAVLKAEKEPAVSAGLQKGDQFRTLNGQEVIYYDQLEKQLGKNKLKEVQLVVDRNGQNVTIPITPNKDAKLGIRLDPNTVETVQNPLSFGESVSKGFGDAFGTVYYNVIGLGKIITGQVSAQKGLSGPVRIGQLFGGEWVWRRFWGLIGMLSMVLAFMNLLPIPALDGGHVMFLSYELISGKKPGDKFLENAQKIGMILLLSLMAFVIFNDVLSFF